MTFFPGKNHAFALGSVFGDGSENPESERVWCQFKNVGRLGESCLLGPHAWCSGPVGSIRFGSRVVCKAILLVEGADARIQVGDWCYLGDDVIVSARASVTIGSRVLIGHGAQIFDNNSHPTDATERHADFRGLLEGTGRVGEVRSTPVRIEDDAWIGMQAIILKGVRVGARSIVAAGGVVHEDVPDDHLAAGNPAVSRPLKKIS